MSDTMLTPTTLRAACAKILPGRKALKLALIFWLPAMLLITGVAYILLSADVNLRQNKLHTQEAGEIRFAEQMLTHDFDSAISDLQLLLQTPALQHYAHTRSPTEKQRLTEQFWNMAQAKQHYDQIRYLDLHGMEKIRINLIRNQAVIAPESELQNKADRYFFVETLKLSAGEIYVSPLDLNTEHGKIELPYKPAIRFGMPVFDRTGNKQGIVLLNFRGQLLLDGFIKAMSEKQHAMLLNHEGYWLSNPKPDLEWSHLLGGNETFRKYYPEAWKTISTQQRGSLLMPEGLYTFTTVHPLILKPHEHWQDNQRIAHTHDDYFWKIVSFIPADELPAITFSQYPRSFALLAAGLILLAFLSLYIALTLHNRRQLRATIFENEARLKEITSTLGEGIF
ncbi:MAG: cache domain-containing protein, partial [Gallionellaceae bacterium]|nr:cache domain-containing protein [Gallionellaceae bacterium]